MKADQRIRTLNALKWLLTAVLCSLLLVSAKAQRLKGIHPFDNTPWSCPPSANQTNAPKLNNKGDRLYVHITDKTGHDFELWCRGSNHYSYEISYPGGRPNRVISTCEFEGGINDLVVWITGKDSFYKKDSTSYWVVDTLKRIFHHNWEPDDNWWYHRDFHLTYDFKKDSFTRINTERVKGDDGHRYDKVLYAESRGLGLFQTDEQVLKDNRQFLLHSFPGLKEPTTCGTTARAPDSVQIDLREFSWGNNTAEAIFPYTMHLDNFSFDGGKKVLKFMAGNSAFGEVNLTIPGTVFQKTDTSAFNVMVNGASAKFSIISSSTQTIFTISVSKPESMVQISLKEGTNPPQKHDNTLLFIIIGVVVLLIILFALRKQLFK
jgi:hypothetical protein